MTAAKIINPGFNLHRLSCIQHTKSEIFILSHILRFLFLSITYSFRLSIEASSLFYQNRNVLSIYRKGWWFKKILLADVSAFTVPKKDDRCGFVLGFCHLNISLIWYWSLLFSLSYLNLVYIYRRDVYFHICKVPYHHFSFNLYT